MCDPSRQIQQDSLRSSFGGRADLICSPQVLRLVTHIRRLPHARIALKVRVRLSSFDMICQMVEGGAGLAIVPQATGRRWQRFMALRIAALTDPWTVRHLSLCVRSVQSLPTHARKLLVHLRNHGSSDRQRPAR